jgi:steroid 5-alpha reductase family enzyme
MLQMLLMLVVSAAILVTNLPGEYRIDLAYLEMTGKWHSLFIIGIVIAISGLIFETISDIQLSKFIETKKPGEIFTS